MTSRTLTADRGDAGRRLDLVLRRRLADVAGATRTRVQGWIEAGCVTVNGRRAYRVALRVAAGDVIAVALEAAPRRHLVEPEDRPVDVLYEDAHIVAVNKPSGMVVHPAYKHPAGTLLNALLGRTRGHDDRPALVGRLDRLTSGLVVAARTRSVYAALHRALRAGEKDYLAVAYGPVKTARGRIELPLARDAHDRRRVIVSPDGSPSVTRFERLARTPSSKGGLALLRCRLVTGRTHQIRVHLAARGWPIVGDPVYGEPRYDLVEDPQLAGALRAFPRQALHARRIVFTHPVSGAHVTIEAPIPSDLRQLLEATGLPVPVEA